MSQRTIRVNSLILQEISSIIHTRFKDSTVYVTINEVDIAPDLRNANVYYSVFGGADKEKAAKKFFHQNASEIRRMLGKRIVLKYLPHLFFSFDESSAKGVELINLMDEIEETDKTNEPSE